MQRPTFTPAAYRIFRTSTYTIAILLGNKTGFIVAGTLILAEKCAGYMGIKLPKDRKAEGIEVLYYTILLIVLVIVFLTQ